MNISKLWMIYDWSTSKTCGFDIHSILKREEKIPIEVQWFVLARYNVCSEKTYPEFIITPIKDANDQHWPVLMGELKLTTY